MIPPEYLQPEFTLGARLAWTSALLFVGIGMLVLFYLLYEGGNQSSRGDSRPAQPRSVSVLVLITSVALFLPNLLLGQLLARLTYHVFGWDDGHLLVYLPVAMLLLYIPVTVLEVAYGVISLPLLLRRRARARADAAAPLKRRVLRPDLLPDWYKPELPQPLFEAMLREAGLAAPPSRDAWDQQYARLSKMKALLRRDREREETLGDDVPPAP